MVVALTTALALTVLPTSAVTASLVSGVTCVQQVRQSSLIELTIFFSCMIYFQDIHEKEKLRKKSLFTVFGDNLRFLFDISPEIHKLCVYSLEVPRQGASNENLQHLFEA